MAFYYPEVVQWNMRVARGRYIRQSFLLLVTLSSWMTSTEAQASTATKALPCGGTLTDSGVIQSPNYPLNYPNNARCSWHLSSRFNNTGIRIQFNTFALEKYFDYITIYNELNSKRYSGGNNPPTTLVGKDARIEFYSDILNTMTGFSATFSSVDVTSRYQCLTNDTFWCNVSKKCISSNWLCDGHPDCTYNEDESSCSSATTTNSTRTSLSRESECQRLGGFWCSRSAQCVPTSFKCDNYSNCVYGEDEEYCPTSAATTAPPCGGTLTDSGVIQSPNYPLNYPNLARCLWTLSSRSNNSGFRIQFNTFALEKDFDYITIYNELNSKRYTGRDNPPTTLVGKRARIAFYSDTLITMKGFSATFSSVDVTSRYQCLTNDTFWCYVSKKCISSNWLCDGYPDCTYNEDESLCSSATTTKSTALQQQCAQNQRFWCGTSSQCIYSYQRCNQVNDCLHGEDEDGCLSTVARAAIIIVGSLCMGVLAALIRVGCCRAETRAIKCKQTITKQSATVWSKKTTSAIQFEAPNRQAGGPQGASGQPSDQYAPPTYDATGKAHASGEHSHPSAQSGELRPFLNTPAITSPSTN